jgi:ATP-dependent helicase STH1/SNF2
MKQIKRKIEKDVTYSLPTFKADMHMLWDNARMYNQEGSWVYEAADAMQEVFDEMYEEALSGATGGIASGSGVTSGVTSQGGSGTSTPMYKAGGAPATTGVAKIKLNLGTKLKAQSVVSENASGSGSDSGDDEDDDY